MVKSDTIRTVALVGHGGAGKTTLAETLLARAGAGVALHAKPAVAAESALRVNHGDLTALLFLQGYARAEFVA